MLMQLRSKGVLGVSLCLGLGVTHVAQAALVNYPMGSAAGVAETGVTATSLASSADTARAVTLEFNYAQTPTNVSPAAADASILRITGISDTDIATSDETFFFTLTPDAGKKLDLSSIEFDLAAGGTGTRQTYVRYSFNGGSTFTSTAVATATTSPTNQYRRHSFALVDQNPALNETSSPVLVEFILATPATGSDLRIDNIVVQGAVVPEPATLSAVALTGLLLGRRRHRQALR